MSPGLLALALLCTGPESLSAAVARVGPAVVSISVSKLAAHSDREESGLVQVRANGSGFVFDERGYILTCNHVISDYEAIEVRFADGREYAGSSVTVVGRDPVTDLAVLKVESEQERGHSATGLQGAEGEGPSHQRFVAVLFGDSDSLKTGQWVAAVGNPFGLDGSATAGIVSGLDRWGLHKSSGPDFQEFIQTDALINPGNSGGPLVDMEGRVVGVLSFARTSARDERTGIGFATPSNLARHVADQLVARGAVIRGYLGTSTQPISPAIGRALGLDGGRGALVVSVAVRSPAESAGMRPGDAVLALDGAPVPDVRWLQNELAARRPGDTVRLVLARRGKRVETEAVLAAWPVAPTAARTAPPQRYRLGLLVQDVDDAARTRTGASWGAVVREVEPASVADDADLRPGDVIIELDFSAVRNAKAFGAAAARPGERPMLVRVLRGRSAFYTALDH